MPLNANKRLCSDTSADMFSSSAGAEATIAESACAPSASDCRNAATVASMLKPRRR